MQLNHKTFGQGDPLVIVHGLFGTLDNWQTLGKRFAEEYSVYLVDQRDHGRSPHSEAITFPLLGSDLGEFMEQQFMYEAHLLGHSMGGKSVMQFALDHPDRVDKLIVVDVAPKAYSASHHEIFEALFAVDLVNLKSRSEANDFLATKIKSSSVRQFLLKNLSRDKENGGFRWKLNLPLIYKHYNDILANVTWDGTPYDKPALFIRGAESDYVQDEDFPIIYKMFPQARIETVQGAGHWVHAQQPEELYRLVSEFLAE